MKTSTIFHFLSLASLAMAAPVKEEKEPEQSPNPAAKMPYWFLSNCTGGNLRWCQDRGTECNGAWPTSNNAWCEQHCDCLYWDGCSDFCLTEVPEGQGAANEEVVTGKI
ncbi:hypothetical protein FDECE_4529 [Fusarium decemcellulare]|nr:hypothetical protein FDECE_4529 [Fusarium decemcellulare]